MNPAVEITVDSSVATAKVDERLEAAVATVTVIEPRSGWQLVDWRELVAYRDLFRFLVWREIKARYAQSAIGVGWAILQPLASMIVFTIVFGLLARVASDGVPYAVFSLSALVLWTYFSTAVLSGTTSLVVDANLLSKVYFPRLLLPLAPVAARLVDLLIGLVILAVLLPVYGEAPNAGVLLLPFLILLMVMTAAGLSIWLTALAVQYRDVKHAATFGVQLLMYAAPVVYPTSLIPERFRLAYAMNPMVGVIEGFRAALFGRQPMPWDFLAVGTCTAALLLLSGMLYFRRRERVFADVA